MNMRTTPFTVEFLGTPEAGKTTVISRMICTDFTEREKIVRIRESAEITPTFFEKGSIPAHFWMRLNTAKNILEKKFSSNSESIILIDRGIVDTIFWDYYFGKIGKLSPQKITHANDFFKDLELMPDLVVFLTTTPKEAITRRGGEGRIVTLEFVTNFNNALSTFMKEVSVPVFHLDTTYLTKDEVYSIVSQEIIKKSTSS